MTDDQQQPGQPPAGAPGAWPPPQDQTVVQPTAPAPGGWAPPPAGAPAGWAPPQQPPQAWGQPPAYPPQPQPFGQQPGYPPQPGYSPQPGYPPAYGQPAYAPTTFGAPQYAGFWIRFVAYIIDSVIVGVALFVCILLMLIIIGIPLFFIVALGYFPFFWWKGGATPGMQMLGLRVVRAVDGGPIDGQMAVIRMIGFIVNSWVLDIGFIWVAFEPRKRGWHDMMANTVVIHTN